MTHNHKNPAVLLLLAGLALLSGRYASEAAMLRSDARRVSSSSGSTVTPLECTYAQGTILDGDDDGDEGLGQTGMVKHLCVTTGRFSAGMIYSIPHEAVLKLEEEGLLFEGAKFAINGAHVAHNYDPDDKVTLGAEWSIEALFEGDRRRLQIEADGEDTVIVARVTATDSSVSYSSSELQQLYFGTDRVSVANQYNLCSAGEYTLVPDSTTEGVVELDWDFPSNGVTVGDSIENSLRQAFESAHGNLENYDHVIYCLPGGFNSFRGYTNSATNEIFIYNEWCGYLSLPFHEIGRNLGLAISNGADGTEFEDRSGMMGVSYATPLGPRMCFNGHKFWILDWFSPYQRAVDPSLTGATSIDLATFVDFRKLSAFQRPYSVVVKVGTLYLVYNLQKDHNSETQGRANQVTITEGAGFASASRSLGGIDSTTTSFSATTSLNSGNQEVIIEFCEENTATSNLGGVDAMRISIRTGSQSRTCDIIDAPSAAPSQDPTPAPSTQPTPAGSLAPSILATAFPTPSALLCDDTDGLFYIPALDREEPCIWLQARLELVASVCTEGSQARAVCPETCGACSDECFDTRKEFEVDGALRNCEWLRIRPGQQEMSCVVGNGAYAACPETCNACDGRDYPSLSPSASPSNSPSAKGDSPPPTSSPTVSVAPSVPQTQSPSTLACDDDPDRTFPVPTLGTNEPCIWLADRPLFQEALCVEGQPAYDICEETCGKCTDNCTDTDGSFTLGGTQRDCEWLRLRQGIQSVVCIVGSEATSVCPETCNACEGSRTPTTSPSPSTAPFCDDDPFATFPVPSLGTNEPCIWLAERPSQQPELCKGPAFHICAETCGKCTDDCHDTFGTFNFENNDRDCQWLRIRTGVQAVVCVPGNDAYETVCPETCNSCDAEQFPSASPRPSSSPSKSPRPTSYPSASPSSDTICDDDPDARFPVPSLGTNEPCIWLADRPQFKPELCVKGNPAYDICEETCGKCSDDCDDTFGTFKLDDVQRDCTWLKLRRGIQKVVCVVGNEAYTVCPETCNACDGGEGPPSMSPVFPSAAPSGSPSYAPSDVDQTQRPTNAQRDGIVCDDKYDQTFLVESTGETQGCLWLQARPSSQAVLCKPDHSSGAYNICEETCGKCSDNCNDTGATFTADGTNRDCEWLRLRRGQQDLLCFEGSLASLVCPETCNSCDQKAEPSASPSTSVAPSTDFCDDTDGDFFTSITGKREPCIWLEDRPQYVAELCAADSEASRVCPETCGVCKDNCEDSTGTFVLDGTPRDCGYLKVRPGLVMTVCVEGSEAYDVCPETCDKCDQKAAPSASPSTSVAPSTDFCDDTDGDFFTSITGKREPCIWLEDRPQYVAELCVSDSEASRVCPESCGICKDNCEDSTGTFVLDGTPRDCGYLKVRPGLVMTVCVAGSEAYDVCPETCDKCDGKASAKCDDTDGDFFVEATGKNEPCIWLQARPTAIANLCTAGSDASTVCPETCGVCQDDCEDTALEFLVNGVPRDCGWLRVRPGEHAVQCQKDMDAYTACPETCNGCD